MQRTRKAITRLLAVVAVIVAFIAIYVVVMNGMSSNEDSGRKGNQPGRQADNPNGNPKPKPQKKVPKTYTVKEGDTLGAIAARYGLKGTTILRLNPGVDAQSLSVGAKLKLR